MSIELIKGLEVRVVRRWSAAGVYFDDVHYAVRRTTGLVEHYYTRYRNASGGEAYERQKFLKYYNMREIT